MRASTALVAALAHFYRRPRHFNRAPREAVQGPQQQERNDGSLQQENHDDLQDVLDLPLDRAFQIFETLLQVAGLRQPAFHRIYDALAFGGGGPGGILLRWLARRRVDRSLAGFMVGDQEF